MAQYKLLVIHCTATPQGRNITKDNIMQMHLGPRIMDDGVSVSYKGKIVDCINSLPVEKIGGIDAKELRGRGWDRLGYSELIQLDGSIIKLTPYNDDDVIDNHEMTWGATGINSLARHIVYAGGVETDAVTPKDTRTEQQKRSLAMLVFNEIRLHPAIKVAGHYHFANKACPSFDVEQWLKEIGVPDKNIYRKF